MLFFRQREHYSYVLNHAALATTFQRVIGVYLPKVLKKNLSVKDPQCRKVLNSLITVELQVVTPWWEPQPLKQADLLHLSSKLNQLLWNTYPWRPECKSTRIWPWFWDLKPITGAVSVMQRFPQGIFPVTKGAFAPSGSHWVCERWRKRNLLC